VTMRELENDEKQTVGRHANNLLENSHLPFRRRERAMPRFREMKSLQKSARSMRVSNPLNLERHLH
jgi:putative transposase